MRLTYQTGIAALIHLAVITVLNVANGVQSGIQQCSVNGSDCAADILLAMLYFGLLTSWFTALWILAAATQTKRSRKLAALLIAAESLVILVALFNAQGNSGLGFVTSIIDAALAAWVSLLALRLFFAGGRRVTGSKRTRQRRLAD